MVSIQLLNLIKFSILYMQMIQNNFDASLVIYFPSLVYLFSSFIDIFWILFLIFALFFLFSFND